MPVVLFTGQIWLAVRPWQSRKRERESEGESRSGLEEEERRKKKKKEKKKEGGGLISGCLMDLIIGFL
jgi:hypothetical protein